jgi:Sortase domain
MSSGRPPVTRPVPGPPPPNYPRQANGWPFRGRGRSCAFPKRGLAAWILAILAFFGGGVLLATYLRETAKPHSPTAQALPFAGARPPPDAATPLGRSTPTHIDIDAIHVHAPVESLGTAPDGSVEVPPIDQPKLTGWYRGSVTPGQVGNSVILGHVDSVHVGQAVFYRLGDLKAGDLVSVTRKDHSVAVFRVYGVASFAKSRFPTSQVYGPSSVPELRLVTCGGTYDAKHHTYLHNIVAAATLVSSRRF